jgi:hypothetical protein
MAWFRDLPATRRVVMLGVTAVVAMVLGAVLVGVRGGGPSNPPAATQTASGVPAAADEAKPQVGHGPSDVTAGVGVGFTHDEAGAVAAAVSYASAPQSWLYLSDEDVTAGVAGIVVPEARDEFAGDVVQEVRLLRTELEKASGTVWFVVSPLATRVEDYDGESGRAVVRVWSVRVLSAEGVAVPQSGWHTTTFRLRWHEDDWKIVSTDEADGPVPQLEVGLQPWTADYVGIELEGFVRLGTTP